MEHFNDFRYLRRSGPPGHWRWRKVFGVVGTYLGTQAVQNPPVGKEVAHAALSSFSNFLNFLRTGWALPGHLQVEGRGFLGRLGVWSHYLCEEVRRKPAQKQPLGGYLKGGGEERT